MTDNYNIKPFIKLGGRLEGGIPREVIGQAVRENPWFTERSITEAVEAIRTQMLDQERIGEWLAGYPAAGDHVRADRGQSSRPIAGSQESPDPGRRTRPSGGGTPKRVGVIMAGNIPLVGFADMMYVLVSGNICVVKPSSKDSALVEYVIGLLREIDAGIPIEHMTDDSMLDALIATGSDETKEIFKIRYGALPSVLRGSRTSVAVLTGDESQKEMEGLAEDIFSYYGLGCRNVSMIYVPREYDVRALGAVLALSFTAIDNPRYINGYRQNKALNTMQGKKFYDGGFFTLTGGTRSSERLSDIVYVRYDEISEPWLQIAETDDKIQCVVAHEGSHPRRVGFGMAQHPGLGEYPDGIDVMVFLLSLNAE